jgi:hypothetical protein
MAREPLWKPIPLYTDEWNRGGFAAASLLGEGVNNIRDAFINAGEARGQRLADNAFLSYLREGKLDPELAQKAANRGVLGPVQEMIAKRDVSKLAQQEQQLKLLDTAWQQKERGYTLKGLEREEQAAQQKAAVDQFLGSAPQGSPEQQIAWARQNAPKLGISMEALYGHPMFKGALDAVGASAEQQFEMLKEDRKHAQQMQRDTHSTGLDVKKAEADKLLGLQYDPQIAGEKARAEEGAKWDAILGGSYGRPPEESNAVMVTVMDPQTNQRSWKTVTPEQAKALKADQVLKSKSEGRSWLSKQRDLLTALGDDPTAGGWFGWGENASVLGRDAKDDPESVQELTRALPIMSDFIRHPDDLRRFIMTNGFEEDGTFNMTQLSRAFSDLTGATIRPDREE